MKKLAINQRLAQDSGYPLISRERTDKLDLLQHLTANLARSVIVLGPEGVGKTHLLNLFHDTLSDSSLVCAFNGDSLLTLEKIQGQISETIAQKLSFKLQSLPETLEKLPRQHADVVLLVDDAGKLAPGVMELIISYAQENPALRIVFALTHNELYLKNTTDSAIDDCYQIEIPPLTELQCADFLEYLSTLPNPRIDFNAINETMVADLYRQTHGIPGKILEILPKPRNLKRLDYSAAILTCAVTGLIAIALGVQWWSSRPKPATKSVAENKVSQTTVTSLQPVAPNSQPLQQLPVPPNPTVADIDKANATSVPQNNAIASQSGKDEVPASQTVTTVQGDAKSALSQAPTGQVQAAVNEANTGSKTTQSPAEPVQAVTGAANTTTAAPAQTPQVLDEGGQWVMQQPAENITLQLMALSDKQTILEVMQRHQTLGQSLKYLKTTTKRGKDRFILLYGSFASPGEASAEAKKLPDELRKTWVRRMNSLQAELLTTSTLSPSAPAVAPASP